MQKYPTPRVRRYSGTPYNVLSGEVGDMVIDISDSDKLYVNTNGHITGWKVI